MSAVDTTTVALTIPSWLLATIAVLALIAANGIIWAHYLRRRR